MECFNDAMLAKQVWRLLQESSSLVAHVLKARYYPLGDILSAGLGNNPSYTWRSLHSVREVIEQGSRWIVGNGRSLKIWSSRWLPRPGSFRPILGSLDADDDLSVADFIDTEAGCWREELVCQTFLPINVDIILQIPLCTSWPDDKLIWHYSADGVFSVRSAYHLLRSKLRPDIPSSSSGLGQALWKRVWRLNVPPRIRLFGWRLGIGVLPTRGNIASRILGYDMRCELCGHLEDHDVHALFECPMAVEIWKESSFAQSLWSVGLHSAKAYLLHAVDTLDPDRLGDYVAVMWAIWNERHRVIFGQQPLRSLQYSANRALQL